MTVPIAVLGCCAANVEFQYPDGTVESTNWTANPHSVINDQSDATWASSDSSTATCPSTNTYDFEVHLPTPTNEIGPSECQGIRYRARCRKQEISGTGQVDISMRLMQGGTQIDAFGGFTDISTSWVTMVSTLSTTEVDSITNATDLRIEVTAVLCGDVIFDQVECDCSQAEIEYYLRA